MSYPNVPEQEQTAPGTPSQTPIVPEREHGAGGEPARAEFEAARPEFGRDPVDTAAPAAPAAPVAPPAAPVTVIPAEVREPPLVPVAGAPVPPPTADEYERVLARKAAEARPDHVPHPATVPVALRPTPQGPHYPEG